MTPPWVTGRVGATHIYVSERVIVYVYVCGGKGKGYGEREESYCYGMTPPPAAPRRGGERRVGGHRQGKNPRNELHASGPTNGARAGGEGERARVVTWFSPPSFSTNTPMKVDEATERRGRE